MNDVGKSNKTPYVFRQSSYKFGTSLNSSIFEISIENKLNIKAKVELKPM